MARTSYLNPKLYNKLYAVMQYENSLALRVCLETGLRIDDVLHLRASDLKGRTLFLIESKTKKKAKKVISYDLAKRLRQITKNGRIFDGRFGNKPRTRQAVWRDVKKAAKKLQLDGNIAPHSARKTYAVEDFHEHGLAQTQKDLQHDRMSTTLVYAFADLLDGCGGNNGGGAFLWSERNDTTAKTDDGQKNNATEPANTTKIEQSCNDAPQSARSLAALAFAEVVADKVLERIEPLILSLTTNS